MKRARGRRVIEDDGVSMEWSTKRRIHRGSQLFALTPDGAGEDRTVNESRKGTMPPPCCTSPPLEANVIWREAAEETFGLFSKGKIFGLPYCTPGFSDKRGGGMVVTETLLFTPRGIWVKANGGFFRWDMQELLTPPPPPCLLNGAENGISRRSLAGVVKRCLSMKGSQ